MTKTKNTKSELTNTKDANIMIHTNQNNDNDDENGQMMSRYHRHSLARAHRRCCVRFGHTHVLCSLSQQHYGYFPTTCHVGPHWGCLLVTYFLAIGPFIFLMLFVDELRLGLQVALFASMCVTTVSLTLVACSDPGVVFQDVESDVEDVESGIVCGRMDVVD